GLTTATTAHVPPRGFRPVDLSDDLRATFFSAISTDTKYGNAGDPFVCVTKIDHVYQQIIKEAYKFLVQGCAVEAAADSYDGCDCGDRAIGKYSILMFGES
ncbi:hypothetical protein As57867_005012, partial [Aphanomyces stellatus]